MDSSEEYEGSIPLLKVSTKARDRNWIPLVLPSGCPGEMLSQQIKSLSSWFSCTYSVFAFEAEKENWFPSCDASESELHYIDASFVTTYLQHKYNFKHFLYMYCYEYS